MAVNRYPRRGYRLAPALLRELLEIPPPLELVASFHCGDLLLSDLDESVWRRFDGASCHELALAVVATVGRAARRSSSLKSKPLPAMPAGMSLADLELEARTQRRLVAAGIGKHSQFQSMTVGEILGIRGFGAKSLVDLLTSLEYVIDHRETLGAEVSRGAETTATATHASQRYPRSNERLAPQTLREWLHRPLPATLARHVPAGYAQLCDLDATIWSELTNDLIERLGRRIVSRVADVVSRDAIAEIRVPTPPLGMRLGDLRLENRTRNRLRKAGFDERPEELGNWTLGEILALHSFGAKCLVDLLVSLETYIAKEGRYDEAMVAEAAALGRLPEAEDIGATDLRWGERLRAIDNEAISVASLAQRIVEGRLTPPDPRLVCEQLREVHATIRRQIELPLQEEFIEIFTSGARCRDRQIVTEYYGWSGYKGRTLGELASEHRLSRERVRQVCVAALKRGRGVRVFAPVLDRTLAFILTRLPMEKGSLEAELVEAGYASRPLEIEAIHVAAEAAARGPGFAVIEIGSRRLVVSEQQTAMPRAIALAAKQVVGGYGAARLSDIQEELGRKYPKNQVDPALIRESLERLAEFCWLDGRRTWFRPKTLSRYGLPRLIEKILSVASRIELVSLVAALTRYRRNGRRPPPPRVVLEFCRQMPGVHIEETLVVADQPPDLQTALSGVERVMVEVLEECGEAGPAMDRGAFEEECAGRGLNRFSFHAAIMNSPVIVPVGRGVYGLLGSNIAEEAVERLIHQTSARSSRRIMKLFGRKESGKVYIGYQLSATVISGGIVTVPVAMRPYVRGKYTLRCTKGHPVGTLVAKRGCGGGLLPALRYHDAKQGDHMLLFFDLPKREVKIHIGDEAIFDGLHGG